MKKWTLTISAVILFMITAAAQDTTRTESDQYRVEPLQQQDTTAIDYYQDDELEQDTSMQQFDQDQLQQYRNPEEIDDVNLDSTFQQLNEELEQDAPMNNEEPALEQEGEKPVQDQEADQARRGGRRQARAMDEIEVVEDKEGPNHEVVYRYQGELFYVDREKEELINVDRSELNNSKHEVEIKEGIATDDAKNDSRKKNSRKDKSKG